MLRKSARVSGRLLVSAFISWSLIPIAVADAPTPSANPTSAAQSAEANFKRLHTVPLDGMGDDHWLSGATNLVQEILSKRPNEDLVICVAGCIGKQDRVVYAQPSEPTSRQTSRAVSEASPVPADATTEKSAFVPTMAEPAKTDAQQDGAVEAKSEPTEQPSAESSEQATPSSESAEPAEAR